MAEEEKKDEALEEGVTPDSPSEGIEEKEEREQQEEEAQGKTVEDYQSHIDNLNAALRDERDKYRGLEQKLTSIEEKLQPKEESEEEYDPDSYLTHRDINKIFEKQRREDEKRFQAQTQYSVTLKMSEERFKETHDDYDKVIKSVEPLLAKEPDLYQSIMKDPEKAPQRAYILGKGYINDVMKEQENKSKAQTLLESTGPKTSESRGGGKPAPGSVDLSSMTLDEVDAYLQSLPPAKRKELTGM
jgi:hypothetical protein